MSCPKGKGYTRAAKRIEDRTILAKDIIGAKLRLEVGNRVEGVRSIVDGDRYGSRE
jgi:hypothetical protein